MRTLAMLAVFIVAGCSQEPSGPSSAPRQYGAPVPLVLAPPQTFDTPVFRAPGATLTCYQFGNTTNCY